MDEKIEKKNTLETRFYNFEIRKQDSENEGEKIIDGRPIVYESKTDLGFFDEIIEKGALDGANLTDVRFLVNHDTKMIPLARSRRNNGNSTMQLKTDDKGLLLEWVKLDVKNNPTASSLYSAIERGDIDGMSFMFSIDDEEWEDLESDHPTRIIKKIGSVVEVSAVTFPAYDATSINARSKDALDSARKAVETSNQQRAEALDSDKELVLAKAKYHFNENY